MWHYDVVFELGFAFPVYEYARLEKPKLPRNIEFRFSKGEFETELALLAYPKDQYAMSEGPAKLVLATPKPIQPHTFKTTQYMQSHAGRIKIQPNFIPTYGLVTFLWIGRGNLKVSTGIWYETPCFSCIGLF
jgi:hypothetical protein